MAARVGWGEFLRGYVVLRVEGRRPDAFLARLVAEGARFRAARREGQALVLRLGLRDFRGVRPAARGCRVRVRIAGRGGLPFLVARVRRRPALAGALVAAAAAGVVLSHCVWFVQVRGADRLPPAEILRAAAAAGLRPGVWRGGLDTEAVAAHILRTVPDLSFAGVSLRGTLATISVAERSLPPPGHADAGVPGDVVAAHGGIVRGLAVTAGLPEVRPGESVRAGQVLIRGVVRMAPSRQAGSGGARDVPVHAAGVVLAVQTYEAYAEAPASLTVGVPTGQVHVRRVLVVGRHALVLAGRRPVPWAAYRLERGQWGPLRWRGLAVPVELLTLRYLQVRPHERPLAPDAAASVAAAQARAFLLRQLPAHARILQQRQTTTLLPGGRVGVELWVESEDNIGVFRPAQPPAAPTSGSGSP